MLDIIVGQAVDVQLDWYILASGLKNQEALRKPLERLSQILENEAQQVGFLFGAFDEGRKFNGKNTKFLHLSCPDSTETTKWRRENHDPERISTV